MNASIPLDDELLSLMRSAAQRCLEQSESLITPHCIALTLRELALVDERFADLSIITPENGQPTQGDEGATLRFKTPDGSSSVALSAQAYRLFIDGAVRAGDLYTVHDVAAALSRATLPSPRS